MGVALLVVLALVHRDEIRERAEVGLGRGMPALEAALARGFVLGEDETVDEGTVEDFRRAGLAHLLAVSGQNVALLALLTMPLLALLGMSLGTRLVWILGAIVVYVPLAGAGPSIVRAGLMGGLSVLATLAGRRTSRLYALAVAAVVTLAIDPGIAADVGWQLSFAAVFGILALASPLRAAIVSRLGKGAWQAVLADGVAMTVAATLATAPLLAFHFESVSTTGLIANLLALPAVAPAMWLGMLSAAAAQVPGFPVQIVNAVDAPLLAYIAQVAAWCGRPSWAYVHVSPGLGGLIASYAGLAALAVFVPVLVRRHRSLAGGGTATLAVAALLLLVPGRGDAGQPVQGLRVEVLDVGQGDAILLRPAQAPAVLVDGGPKGDDLAAKLREAGVDRIGAAIVTHEQADHAGGIAELLGRFPVGQLAYGRIGRDLRREAEAAGATPVKIAAGGVIRSGSLRLETLWPPPALLAGPLAGTDPNAQALVLLARWHDFSMLLAADAEAEAVPLDPGPVDVLKLAHHGSDDAALPALLERTVPSLGVISVGSANPYGHPTATTLATLAAHGVPTLRTDRDGTVTLAVRRGTVTVTTGR